MTHQPTDGEQYDNALEEEFSKPFYKAQTQRRKEEENEEEVKIAAGRREIAAFWGKEAAARAMGALPISCGNCHNTVTKEGEYCWDCTLMFKTMKDEEAMDKQERAENIGHTKCENCGHISPVSRAELEALGYTAQDEEPARDIHDRYMSCIQCNDVQHESYFVGPRCGVCASKQKEKEMDKKTTPVRKHRIEALKLMKSVLQAARVQVDCAVERCCRDEEGLDRNLSLDQEDRNIRAAVLNAVKLLDAAYDTQPERKGPIMAHVLTSGDDKQTHFSKRREILVNRAMCDDCKQVIYSVHCHDYKTCSCGKFSVDGGLDYLRRIGGAYEELSSFAPE